MSTMLLLLACNPQPQGMVAIPGGSFIMGSDTSPHPDQIPAHTVSISAFQLDATLVTVDDFARHVQRTGAVTSAEQLGYGMVSVEGMADWEWRRVAGATWRAPWGPDSGITQRADEPVVMVSWSDAAGYCAAQGKRLPTEAEWEYAMRAGATGRFPWGDSPTLPDGRLGLNFWQGRDHTLNTLLDGYRYTSPVRAFPPNRLGLHDPVGNVWQWVSDWYSADTFSDHRGGVVDPTGPVTGRQKVARGGSWWCSQTACSAYGLSRRGKGLPEAPYANNGFRCASDRR
jgi:sulfatase modifying factor 1